MVDVVVPELKTRRLEHFARGDHPGESSGLVLMAEREGQLPHAAHLQELAPPVGRQPRKGLPQLCDVLWQSYFGLSSVDTPQGKIGSADCLERNCRGLSSTDSQVVPVV